MPMQNNPLNTDIINEQNTTPDAVSILIDGKTHSTWSDYEIDSDLIIPSDAWRVEVALPRGEFPPAVIPGAEVEVRIGEDAVMIGRIDDIEHYIDKSGHTLRMNGRDQAAVLVDCSAPIFSSKKCSLTEIISQVVKPLGIKNGV